MEYDSLKTEILAWQNRRVTVMTSSLTFVGAALGVSVNFAPKGTDQFQWATLSSVLLFVLSCSMLFCTYAADASSRIGAYLQVFHSDAGRWEEIRGNALKSTLAKRANNLNGVLSVSFLTLGFATCVVASSLAAGGAFSMNGQTATGRFAFWFSVGLFLLVWLWMFWFSYRRRGGYKQLFEAEKNAAPVVGK
jgi:Mg2+ and Co2+ transporter CorA